jgi:hypothetical protein
LRLSLFVCLAGALRKGIARKKYCGEPAAICRREKEETSWKSGIFLCFVLKLLNVGEKRETGSEGYWKIQARVEKAKHENNKMKFTGETVDSLFTNFTAETPENKAKTEHVVFLSFMVRNKRKVKCQGNLQFMDSWIMGRSGR